MSESTEGRYEFYIRIAEMCETTRRHAGEFAKSHLPQGLKVQASMLAFNLQQAEKLARTLAGPRLQSGGADAVGHDS